MTLVRDNDEERQARIEHMLELIRDAHAIATDAHAAASRPVAESQNKLTTARSAIGQIERRLQEILRKAAQARRGGRRGLDK